MKRPFVAGILIAGLYLLTAVASGRLDIFARRPLLDGATPPPPYRWVVPPPDVASANLPPDVVRPTFGCTGPAFEKAAEKTGCVEFTNGVSEGEFVATEDAQASVVLPKGSIPGKPGVTAAAFTIDPRDPAQYRGYPRGVRIRGNVYEVHGTYVGGGNGPLRPTEPPARIILAYPAHTAEFARSTHLVIHSTDGTTWKVLETDNDSPIALQIAISSPELGFFAVAAKPGPPAKKSGSSPIPLVGAVVGVSGLAGVYAWRQAQARKRAQRRQKIARSLPRKGGGGRRR